MRPQTLLFPVMIVALALSFLAPPASPLHAQNGDEACPDDIDTAWQDLLTARATGDTIQFNAALARLLACAEGDAISLTEVSEGDLTLGYPAGWFVLEQNSGETSYFVTVASRAGIEEVDDVQQPDDRLLAVVLIDFRLEQAATTPRTIDQFAYYLLNSDEYASASEADIADFVDNLTRVAGYEAFEFGGQPATRLRFRDTGPVETAFVLVESDAGLYTAFVMALPEGNYRAFESVTERIFSTMQLNGLSLSEPSAVSRVDEDEAARVDEPADEAGEGGTFSTEAFTFDYPAGWTIFEDDLGFEASAWLVSRPALRQVVEDGEDITDLAPGEQLIWVLLGGETFAAPEAVLGQFRDETNIDAAFSPIKTVELGGHPAAEMTFVLRTNEVVGGFLVIDIAGQTLLLTGYAPPGELDPLLQTMRQTAASLTLP
jgi:hypothetical protein